jgi:hypothetical protein
LIKLIAQPGNITLCGGEAQAVGSDLRPPTLSKIATSFYDESGSPENFHIIGVNIMADEASKTDKTSKAGKMKKKRFSKR